MNFAIPRKNDTQLIQYIWKIIDLPQILIDFYSKNEPIGCEIDGIFIHPLDEIIRENTERYPGLISSQYGYIVVASSDHGDAFCFDLNKFNKGSFFDE